MIAGILSQGGHLKPFTTEAFSKMISSFFDLFLVETGSVSLWIRAGEASLGGIGVVEAEFDVAPVLVCGSRGSEPDCVRGEGSLVFASNGNSKMSRSWSLSLNCVSASKLLYDGFG